MDISAVGIEGELVVGGSGKELLGHYETAVIHKKLYRGPIYKKVQPQLVLLWQPFGSVPMAGKVRAKIRVTGALPVNKEAAAFPVIANERFFSLLIFKAEAEFGGSVQVAVEQDFKAAIYLDVRECDRSLNQVIGNHKRLAPQTFQLFNGLGDELRRMVGNGR
jgi:hypothetical protein